MQMSGKFLIDTNIVISLFAGDSTVQRQIRIAKEVFLPSVVLGELYFGAYKSGRVKKNLEKIDEFAVSNSVIVCDTDTAKEYGDIKNALRIKGRPIPENDIWIAAIARQYGLVLATRDPHFNEIDNLTAVRW